MFNFADIDELYDLENDRAEMNNLIDNKDYSDIIIDMRKKMLEEAIKYDDNMGPQAFRYLKNDYIHFD